VQAKLGSGNGFADFPHDLVDYGRREIYKIEG
jgi:hypothetical protein